MTLSEHRRRMTSKSDSGLEFNNYFPTDTGAFKSIEDDFANFEKERQLISYDDFSGLFISIL